MSLLLLFWNRLSQTITKFEKVSKTFTADVGDHLNPEKLAFSHAEDPCDQAHKEYRIDNEKAAGVHCPRPMVPRS